MSDTMPFASVLRQNYVDYLLHLDHGGERFRFEEKREEHPGLVHCSALMEMMPILFFLKLSLVLMFRRILCWYLRIALKICTEYGNQQYQSGL